MKHPLIAAAVLAGLFPCAAVSGEYQALKYPAPPAQGTWAVLDRDGANRRVEPYLSSLGGGEAGTGVIASPPFAVEVDKITFTLCGHDGNGGGREKNFIALVDATSGGTILKTPAPGSDPMRELSWDVAPLKGRKVRIEVHDGLAEGAFAWLGVGRIDAGPPLTVDFSQGVPEGWKVTVRPEEDRTEVVTDGVPFLRRPSVYTLVPAVGECEIPCGVEAQRLFFLGGTVPGGKPLEDYGSIEIVYRDGSADRVPLLFGYTLDDDLKLLSKSKAMYLHPSGDVFEPYLVVACRPEVIEKIVLRRNPKQSLLPRITAITCQTTAANDHLAALPDSKPSAEEAAWIKSHTITADSPRMDEITAEIRRANKM
jgi:hypothetical protein